jgi:uncharacterized protein (TIGR02996 family)
MSEPLSLTEEYVYRIAPDGKSVQAAQELLRRESFRSPRLSEGGTRLQAKCQGSERRPYDVQVDLKDPEHPRTGCNCGSWKHPCKHALGLILLAIQSPDTFESDVPQERRRPRLAVAPMADAPVRQAPSENTRAPADVGEALMQAILAEPEDDTPRLVYADWLEEHGGPAERDRAEFIRVQMELPRTETPARVNELEKREKALWRAHHKEWLAGLPPDLRKRNLQFHRGFFEELHQPARLWATHGDEMFRRHPIFRLRVFKPVDRHEIGALATIPHLTKIRVLMVSECRIDQPLRTLQILFSTPFLSSVRRLVLRDSGFSTQSMSALVDSVVLARLKELDLAENEIGPRGAEVLAATEKVTHLRELLLEGNPIGDAGARALAGSPHLDRLQRLDLRGVELGEKARDALRERFGERAMLD